MAADNDKRAFLHGQRHLRRNRISISFGVGSIQKRHALEVDFTHFQDNRKQLVHAPVIHADRKERLKKEAIDRVIGISQNGRVVSIRRNAADSEQNQRFQRTDILVCLPEIIHIIIVIFAAGDRAHETIRHQAFSLFFNPPDQFSDGVIVKIHICYRGKQSFQYKPAGIPANQVFIAFRRSCKTNQRTRQLILQPGGVRSLAAHTGTAGTDRTACRLLTLVTKHFPLHTL